MNLFALQRIITLFNETKRHTDFFSCCSSYGGNVCLVGSCSVKLSTDDKDRMYHMESSIEI